MELARGQLLAFTDDDVILSVDWLSGLWSACLRYSQASGFCGPIKPMYPANTPLWLRRHPFRVPAFAEFDPPFPTEQPCTMLPFGPNLAVKRLELTWVLQTSMVHYHVRIRSLLAESLRLLGRFGTFQPHPWSIESGRNS
jgi:hypothetical protein